MEKSVGKSAADNTQHLTVLAHGLGQVLHHSVLHIVIPPKIECQLLFLLAADVAEHLAVLLHAADQVLLEIHNVFLHRKVDICRSEKTCESLELKSCISGVAPSSMAVL